MTKAYSYTRFSSPAQALGDSLRRQVENTAKYCALHGLVLDESAKMTDAGLSGYHQDHVKKGALGKFLRLVEDGKIARGSVLIVEHLDRLSRAEPMEAQNQFNSIILAGIDVVTTIDNQRYSREEIRKNPYKLFITLGQMMGSNAESEKKSERIREAWRNRRKGIANMPPSWVIKNKSDGVFEIDEAKANVVRRIFRDIVNMGLQRLVTQLNAEGVPTLSGRMIVRTVCLWDASALRQLVRSRSALGYQDVGVYEGRKRVKTGESNLCFPPIISDGEHYAANKALDVRTKGAKRGTAPIRITNLFGELARCGTCDGRMTVRQRSRLGRFYYLGCSVNKASDADCSHGKYHRLHDAESMVLKMFGTAALKNAEPIVSDEAAPILMELNQAKAKLARDESQYIRLVKILGDDPEDLKALASVKADCRAGTLNIRRLEGLLSKVRTSKPAQDRLHDFKALIAGLDDLKDDEMLVTRHRISLALPGLLSKVVFGPSGVDVQVADSFAATFDVNPMDGSWDSPD